MFNKLLSYKCNIRNRNSIFSARNLHSIRRNNGNDKNSFDLLLDQE